MEHDDECDKVMYEGDTCTCDLYIDADTRNLRDRTEEAREAAGLAMEDYSGPELDG